MAGPSSKKVTKTTKKAAAATPGAEPCWLDAGDGYWLALEDGKLVCRNPKGQRLSSVPKALKDGEVAEQLVAVRDWLEQHARECAATIDGWMLRSLPAPREVLAAVWDDPAWRVPLENAVVAPVADSGGLVDDQAGFLREIGARGVGVVDRDGETQWLDAAQVALPHPILLPDLGVFRELATELGLSQGVSQLHRETWARPEELAAGATSVTDFANGSFAMLMHAVARARSKGYRVRGGFAVCSVWEGGGLTEARYWIGADSPESPTSTGELVWVDGREQRRRVDEIGPVAYSEGMRMASAIWAGRVVEKAEGAS